MGSNSVGNTDKNGRLNCVCATQHRGPTTTCGRHTHFDFHLAFSDGFGILLALEGAQHFWIATKYV